MSGNDFFLASVAGALIDTADGTGESVLGFRTLEQALYVSYAIREILGSRNALHQYELQVRKLPPDATSAVTWALHLTKH